MILNKRNNEFGKMQGFFNTKYNITEGGREPKVLPAKAVAFIALKSEYISIC